MEDITDSYRDVPENIDIIWHEPQFKVIMFVNGLPTAFVNLEDGENDLEHAKRYGRDLLEGSGSRLI